MAYTFLSVSSGKKYFTPKHPVNGIYYPYPVLKKAVASIRDIVSKKQVMLFDSRKPDNLLGVLGVVTRVYFDINLVLLVQGEFIGPVRPIINKPIFVSPWGMIRVDQQTGRVKQIDVVCFTMNKQYYTKETTRVSLVDGVFRPKVYNSLNVPLPMDASIDRDLREEDSCIGETFVDETVADKKDNDTMPYDSVDLRMIKKIEGKK